MAKLTRNGKRKRELRNLIQRGRIWYWKKMDAGKVKFISLDTENLELAKGKRNSKEHELTKTALDQIRGPRSMAGTLAQVFEKYDAIGGLTRKAMEANKISLMRVVRVGLEDEKLEPATVRLDVITKKLARDYQDKMRARYESEAGTNEKERRMARDRADRTSKSTLSQAKSLFCKRRQLIDRYKEANINVPNCVTEFQGTKTVGTMTSKVYFPASDDVLRETFSRIDELRDSDCPELEACYDLFWAALGTGGRRNEVVDMKVTDLVDRNGYLWVGAGLGKDGQQIQIPVINWPVHSANATVPADVIRKIMQRASSRPPELDERGEPKPVLLFEGSFHERYDELGDRLNAWLFRLGWKDEKKLHALRAYLGCKLYAKNPRLAQLYLRHKSISTTEKFYSHFLRLTEVLSLDNLAPVTPPAAPPLAIVQTSEQAA